MGLRYVVRNGELIVWCIVDPGLKNSPHGPGSEPEVYNSRLLLRNSFYSCLPIYIFALRLLSRSTDKCYLKIQSVLQTKRNASSDTSWLILFEEIIAVY